VFAEGRRVQAPRATRFSLSSGIDWLDLEGEIDFETEIVSVPEILERLAQGERFVRLSDGSHGMLPEEWLERAGLLLALSPERREKALRFRPFQALLLDALLESEKHFRPDEAFVRLRERLLSFHGISPAKAPAGFRGKLRDYQKEGLAWLSFLAEYGFGGCLADDMGLGKTIQVLAFLESLRARNGDAKPSLVVVPRSLVHNWLDEGARFAPRLRIRDYSSGKRTRTVFEDGSADVVVTTYGVLRRDFETLKDVAFRTVVLDEAQVIKNEQSQAAKASRLLRAEHRLALSGTPVENHLGELWSLFEFLNPKMLGRLVRSRDSSTETETALLVRAVRPFILRRTKEQVLRELPAKNEQTIVCPLEGRQRELYDELRRHYQRALSEHVRGSGLSGSKMWVIEALLRLRQAACHPDLLERSGNLEGSAKLDALLPRLEEVLSEGHKALVFSQFTTFLAIVRKLLDERELPYEYLDGETRDRKRRVERFQTEPDCGLFLVSLKAGGLGLNLTAADYVFILDPWWNPAVEAQAIDRAHRIGQLRPVFAYRLIAENTVEEKILELQQRKRDLADAMMFRTAPSSGTSPPTIWSCC
jgi:SNF2 family DNA or RNA helicase